ncbi:hypothetical protein BESB_051480 [Besnoitia besnoiti]|uniref:Uncharacterized protein n=1 Tax=Besnoitia besnoiti TaxID=94643 RepID=A0A2A9MIT4_BESBE|nr:hypothetical protein BESB_051480 [Besnoitia besnoiti]PFH35497.1 hypothetical protein BESB_051480 [Besnoitia besnoiti]
MHAPRVRASVRAGAAPLRGQRASWRLRQRRQVSARGETEPAAEDAFFSPGLRDLSAVRACRVARPRRDCADEAEARRGKPTDTRRDGVAPKSWRGRRDGEREERVSQTLKRSTEDSEAAVGREEASASAGDRASCRGCEPPAHSVMRDAKNAFFFMPAGGPWARHDSALLAQHVVRSLSRSFSVLSLSLSPCCAVARPSASCSEAASSFALRSARASSLWAPLSALSALSVSPAPRALPRCTRGWRPSAAWRVSPEAPQVLNSASTDESPRLFVSARPSSSDLGAAPTMSRFHSHIVLDARKLPSLPVASSGLVSSLSPLAGAARRTLHAMARRAAEDGEPRLAPGGMESHCDADLAFRVASLSAFYSESPRGLRAAAEARDGEDAMCVAFREEEEGAEALQPEGGLLEPQPDAVHAPDNAGSAFGASAASCSPAAVAAPSRAARASLSVHQPFAYLSGLSGQALLVRLESVPWIAELLHELRALEAKRDAHPSAENVGNLRVWWRTHAIRLFISGVKKGCSADPALQLRMLQLALASTPLAAAIPPLHDLPPAFYVPRREEARAGAESSGAAAEDECRLRPIRAAARHAEGDEEEETQLEGRFAGMPADGDADGRLRVRGSRAEAALGGVEANERGGEGDARLVVTKADVEAFGPGFVLFTQFASLPLEQRLWCLDQFAFFFVHNCLCATVKQADEASAGGRGGGRGEKTVRADQQLARGGKATPGNEALQRELTCKFPVSASGNLIVSDTRLWNFLGVAAQALARDGHFDLASHLTFALLSLVYDIRAFPAPAPGVALRFFSDLGEPPGAQRLPRAAEAERGEGQASLDLEEERRLRAREQAANISKRNNRWKLPKNIWLQILAKRHDAAPQPAAAGALAASAAGDLQEGSEAQEVAGREIPAVALEPQEIAAVDMADELFLCLKREAAEAAPLLARALLLGQEEKTGVAQVNAKGGGEKKTRQEPPHSGFASQFMSANERSEKHLAFQRIRNTAVIKNSALVHHSRTLQGREEAEGDICAEARRASEEFLDEAKPLARNAWRVVKKENALGEQRQTIAEDWFVEKAKGVANMREKAQYEARVEELQRGLRSGGSLLQGLSEGPAAAMTLSGEWRADLDVPQGDVIPADDAASPAFGFSSLLWYLRLESIFYRTQDINLSSIVYRLLTHLIDAEVPQFLYPTSSASSAAQPSAASSVRAADARAAPLSSLFSSAPAPCFSLSRRGAAALAHAVGALKATRRYEHDLLRALCDALRPNLPLLTPALACETVYNLGCLGYSDPAFAHALARHMASSGVLRQTTVDSMMQLLIGFSRLEFRDDTLTEACIKGLLHEGDKKKKAPPSGQGAAPWSPVAPSASSFEEMLYQERQTGETDAASSGSSASAATPSASERHDQIMRTSVDLLARTHRPQSLFYLLHSISRNFVRSLPLLASLVPALQRFATAVPSNVAVLAFHDLIKMGIWPGPFRRAILTTLSRDIERHALVPLAASTILTWSLWGHFDVPFYLRMAHLYHRKIAAPCGGLAQGDSEETDGASKRDADVESAQARGQKKVGKWGKTSVTNIKVSTQFWSSAYGLHLLALTPRDFVQHVNAVDRQIHQDLLDRYRRQSVQQNAFAASTSTAPASSKTAASGSSSSLRPGGCVPFSSTAFPMRVFARCRHSAEAAVRFSPWQTGSLEGLRAASILRIPEENWIPKSSSFHAEVVAACPSSIRDSVINEQPAGPYEIDVMLPADAFSAWKQTQKSVAAEREAEEDRRGTKRKKKKGKKATQKS